MGERDALPGKALRGKTLSSRVACLGFSSLIFTSAGPTIPPKTWRSPEEVRTDQSREQQVTSVTMKKTKAAHRKRIGMIHQIGIRPKA